MPVHEPSLNDLSLIVPLSATMQAKNLGAVPAPVPFDDELGLAHPAASKATAASAAAARKAGLTSYLLFRSACRLLRWDGFPLPRADCWPPPPPGAPMGLISQARASG